MPKSNSKAQSWSIDLSLGVIVFIAAFFIFYLLLSQNPNTNEDSLKEDASTVIRQVSTQDDKLGIVSNNQFNDSKAGELKSLNYNDLKRRLGVEGDFCIYMEDEDGNVVLINNTYKGIGSSEINISNTPCNQ